MTLLANESVDADPPSRDEFPDTGNVSLTGRFPSQPEHGAFRNALAERIGDGAMSVWFGEGIRLATSVDDRVLFVIVPTNFFRERILTRFRKHLEAAIRECSDATWRVDVIQADETRTRGLADVDPSGVDGRPRQPVPLSSPKPNSQPAARAETIVTEVNPTIFRPDSVDEAAASWPVDRNATQTSQIPGLNSLGTVKAARRLDNFVVGDCNRLAHTAALEMVKSRGASFNPLVIHGAVGLGKTHLLDGIAHSFRSHPAGGRLVHITAEAFTNAFLEAMRTGHLATFRNRFRNAAALVVDDIHFVASKRATQNEFLHTFNALIDEDIPIVLSCDQHPKLVSRLTDELSTRFMAGMVVRLETPDPDVRRLILRTKAAARGIALPDSVIDLVSEHLRASVRELEGALNSLIAHSVLSGRRIDLELARSVLRDTIRHTSQAVTLQEIDAATCQALSIRREDLLSPKPSASISTSRTLAMYLARRHTAASYSEIAQHFGLKNHSSVIAAEKRVKQWLAGKARSRKIGVFDDVSDMLAAIRVSLGV